MHPSFFPSPWAETVELARLVGRIASHTAPEAPTAWRDQVNSVVEELPDAAFVPVWVTRIRVVSANLALQRRTNSPTEAGAITALMMDEERQAQETCTAALRSDPHTVDLATIVMVAAVPPGSSPSLSTAGAGRVKLLRKLLAVLTEEAIVPGTLRIRPGIAADRLRDSDDPELRTAADVLSYMFSHR